MAKRKLEEERRVNGDVTMEDEQSSDEEDFDKLDVEFEWFDPDPEIDFHGIKSLLQQLFDVDASLFDLSALTDLILSQPMLGSTVKVDGKETDAYAFLSVINLKEHQKSPFVATLFRYLRDKSASKPQLAQLASLLSRSETSAMDLKLASPLSQSRKPAIGLILTDRLINCPSEIVPPMYTMLLEEVKWAVEENEPYDFSHYLILSKTYTEVISQLDASEDRPKKKKKAPNENATTMYFHPEDEVFQRHALCSGGFDYTTKQDDGHSDSKRAFQELGIKPQGLLMLLEATKLEAAVQDVTEYLQPPS